jgi:hypothetical protein
VLASISRHYEYIERFNGVAATTVRRLCELVIKNLNEFPETNNQSAEALVVGAFDHQQLVCMGRCTMRECWINGRVQRVGYLAELRLSQAAGERFSILRGGYRYFHGLHGHEPAALWFTSIAADNQRARRILERGLPGLPEYKYLGELTTLLVSTRSTRGSTLSLETAPADELAEFINRISATRNLAAAWTPERLAALSAHHLPLKDFGVVRARGRILAVAALWDQRPFRQTVIHGYSRALAVARPLINTVGRAFAIPRLPDPGSILSHAFLSPLVSAMGNGSLLPDLVAATCRRAAARHVEFVTLALPSNDERLRLLQNRFHCRRYASRIYQVRWADEPEVTLDHRPLLPDVALL